MLNRDKGAAPLYSQIENIIKEQIDIGEFAYGDVFWSEKQLQDYYNVSRVTIRQAISGLVNASYLQCSRGIGTTVVFNKINENLKHVISFSEEMSQHGITMTTSYCEVTLEEVNKQVASKLNIEENALAYKLVRVRCVKDSPIVYSITYLKKSYNMPLDSKLYMDSLYHFLKQEYGIRIVEGRDALEATIANETISRFLNISVGSPIFKRTRTTIDQNNEFVEYSICYYPGDKYKYSVKL